jgi:hypothetical protein
VDEHRARDAMEENREKQKNLRKGAGGGSGSPGKIVNSQLSK